MFKIPIEDFKEEIKAELYGYEEIEEAVVHDFITRLEAYFAAKKGKLVDYKTGMVKLQDENDLFMIVDKFFAAVINDELDQYWQDWEI